MAAMQFGLLSAHNTLAALADVDDEIAEEELPQGTSLMHSSWINCAA